MHACERQVLELLSDWPLRVEGKRRPLVVYVRLGEDYRFAALWQHTINLLSLSFQRFFVWHGQADDAVRHRLPGGKFFGPCGRKIC